MKCKNCRFQLPCFMHVMYGKYNMFWCGTCKKFAIWDFVPPTATRSNRLYLLDCEKRPKELIIGHIRQRSFASHTVLNKIQETRPPFPCFLNDPVSPSHKLYITSSCLNCSPGIPGRSDSRNTLVTDLDAGKDVYLAR